MNCKEFERYFEDWLDGAAPPEVDAHRRDCPRCRALAEELSPTSQWVAGLTLEASEPSPAFWSRLDAALAENDRRAGFWASLAWSASRAVAVLAVVLLVFGLLIFRQQPISSVAGFDAPQQYVDDATLPGPGSGEEIGRDDVVFTLVASRDLEAQR